MPDVTLSVPQCVALYLVTVAAFLVTWRAATTTDWYRRIVEEDEAAIPWEDAAASDTNNQWRKSA
jgi:hypothetical protein